MRQSTPFPSGNSNNQPNNPGGTAPFRTGGNSPQNPPPNTPGQFARFGHGPRLRLRFLEGPRAGEILELMRPQPGDSPLSIGRNPECAIRIEAGDVSRHHSEIFAGPKGELLVRDMGSRNSTLLNEQPISPERPMLLHPGDRMQMGYTVILFEGLTGMLPPAASPADQQSTTSVSAPPPGLAKPAVAFPIDDETFVYIILRTGQRYLFKGDEIIVGRSPACDIIVENGSISRQHARIQRTPNGIYVSDLNSQNKTFVNGVRADAPTLLQDGDILRFGEVEADFRVEDNRLSQVFDVEKLRQMLHQDEETTKDDEAQKGATTADDNMDYTMFDMGTIIDTIVQKPGSGSGKQSPIKDRRLEEGETSLNLNLVVVGRNQRSPSAALPLDPATPPPPATDDRTRFTAVPNVRGGLEVARMEGVYYTEGTGRAATLMLRDVKLGLRQGELVAMVGPSGSGKSEVLKVMAGLLAADKGRVLVLGTPLPTLESTGNRKRPDLENDREISRWRNRNIGYMTNDLSQLNPRYTVLEQVTQIVELTGTLQDARQRQDLAIQRLQMVGIRETEVLRMRPPDLSRREKSLVALARAIANDPPVILADEPLGNLHSKDAQSVFELLQQLVANGKTVFMVTQDQTWARLANRQIEILDGEIVGGLA